MTPLMKLENLHSAHALIKFSLREIENIIRDEEANMSRAQMFVDQWEKDINEQHKEPGTKPARKRGRPPGKKKL